MLIDACDPMFFWVFWGGPIHGGQLYTNASASVAAVVAQVWGRPLSGGGVAAVMLNRGEAPNDISATFAELGLPATVKTVTSTDVLTGKVTRGLRGPVTAYGVARHGVAFVTLTVE